MMKLLLFSILALTAGVLADDPSSRIVRGEEATYGDHPYICSLQYGSGSSFSHICGCVIFKKSHVITAAHCVDIPTRPSNIRIAAGSHNLKRFDQYQQHRNVINITLHERWIGGGDGYPNDIAILKLETDLSFSSHVSAIAIDNGKNGNWSNTNCILTGWGRTSGWGSLASVLQKATIKAIDNNDCRARWSGIWGAGINEGHICFYDGSRSACGGDSGGPVRCGDNIIAGVTSWGISTCSGGYPSVYTRLSKFYDWLQNNS